MVDDKKEWIGGWDVRLVDVNQDTDKYTCCLCDKILKNVIQTSHGERSCKSCYRHYQEISVDKDLCPIHNEFGITVFDDKFGQKELLALQVYCVNEKEGCLWANKLAELEKHLEECDFSLVPCDLCGKMVTRINQNHQDCQFERCKYCAKVVPKDIVKEHEKVCDKAPARCELCLKTYDDRIDHVLSCYATKSGNVCPYHVIGCNKKHEVVKKTELQVYHDKILITTVEKLIGDTEKLETQLNDRNGKIDELNEDIDNLVKENQSLREENSFLIPIVSSIQETKKMMNQFEEKIAKLQKENSELKEELQKPVIKNTVSPVFKNSLANLDKNFTKLSVNVSDLDLRLQLIDNKFSEGTILWKIDNVDYRMAQAKSGEVTALHSAPCYTSAYGYKFCVRIYFNGDGVGKNTHVSLFFVIMKSEYDDVLEWPFNKTVKFEMINVYNPADSVVEMFNTDIKSSSFQKPEREMNIAAGCPMFISIDKFKTGNFKLDKCVYIRTSVTDVKR